MAQILNEESWLATVKNVYNTSKVRKNALDKITVMVDKGLKAHKGDKAYEEKALNIFLNTNKKMGGLEGHENVIVPEFSVKDDQLVGKFTIKDDPASVRKGYEEYLAAHGLKIVK